MSLLLLLACSEPVSPAKEGGADTAGVPDSDPHTGLPDSGSAPDSGETTEDTAPEPDTDTDTDTGGGVTSADLLDPRAVGTRILDDAPVTAIAGVGDLTGDGVGDLELVRLDRVDGVGSNSMLVYAGGPPPSSPWTGDPSEAHHVVDGLTWFATLWDTGDVDGDGADDLSLVGMAYWGSIAYVLGPLAAGASSASAAIEVDVEHYGLWAPAWAGVDVDGDGAADFAAANDGHGDGMEVPSERYFTLYFGGGWSDPCDVRSDNGGAVSTSGPTGVLGDGDGDGLPELAFTLERVTWVVRGADVPGLCDAYVEDLADGWRDESFDGYYLGDPLGDWDGDGYGEFAAYGAGGFDTGEAAIWILSAADALGGAYDETDARGSWVAPVDDTSVEAVQAADVDGDGTNELLLSGYDEYAVIRGGTLPAPNDDLPEHRLRYSGSAVWWCGYIGACGDVTGDGREDLLFWVMNSDAETMDAWLVPGFEVPWEDPSAW